MSAEQYLTLEYCEHESPKPRWSIAGPVELLIEHPFADRRWTVFRKLPEPQWPVTTAKLEIKRLGDRVRISLHFLFLVVARTVPPGPWIGFDSLAINLKK